MMKNITIGKKTIGVDQEPFFVAEVGTTANGNVETAKKLIDACLEADLDAVKFQIIGAEEINSDYSQTYTYKTYGGQTKTEPMVEMLKQYRFAPEEWKELKEYADHKGIIFFASVDYFGGVDIAESLNFPAYKVSCWDLNYYPFLERIAKLQKPVFLDTGPADVEGLARVINIFRKEGNDQLIIMHEFHTSNFHEMNMHSIEYIREAFQVLTGFSASDRNFEIDVLALPFRPAVMEKRLTLNKKDPGHHHALSLEPQEMKEYVKNIKALRSAVGEYGIFPSSKDLEDKLKYWRRIVAKKDIKEGEKFTKENIECRRPMMGGLDPMYYDIVLRGSAKADFKINDPITWDKISL